MPQMECLVLILSKTEKMDTLLKTLVANDVKGCTILDSEGMARYVTENDTDISHFSGLRTFLNPTRSRSKTLLIVGSESSIADAVRLIMEVIGDIADPDTGIMFTLPIDKIYGLHKNTEK